MTPAVTTAKESPFWQTWWPDLTLGALALVFGLWETWSGVTSFGVVSDSRYLVVLGMATAAALFRRAPGLALALVWMAGAVQVLSGIDVMLVELLVGVVSFGCARYGRPLVVWLSGLSIPAAAIIAMVYVGSRGTGLAYVSGLDRLRDVAPTRPVLVLGISALVPLVLPWLLGLVLRVTAQSQRSEEARELAETERGQAEEIAALREEQARMARDVHDVVGHSLAVILAQAESAQYLKDADTAALKQTMENIATSARSSLQDVRQVLTTTEDQRPAARPGGPDSLIEGVRASGHEVRSTEVGTPQPLPPELDNVAFRVLQEMLTNAIKHGRRDAAIDVERHWEGELRLEVRNLVGTPAPDPSDLETMPMRVQPPPAAVPTDKTRGLGLDGMRRRLESVGGRLDVRRRDEPGGATYTTTAWVPLRSVR